MKLGWRNQRQTEGLVQVPAMSGDGGKNGSDLMNGVEKGFFEAALFTLSLILHLLHSSEENTKPERKIASGIPNVLSPVPEAVSLKETGVGCGVLLEMG